MNRKKIGDFSVVRGNKNTFLGMSIEINKNIIQIDMVEQLWKCMKMFVEDVSMPVMYPEEKLLFEVREDE